MRAPPQCLALLPLLLAACPDDPTPHPPLPARGDASTFDRGPLGPFFDASLSSVDAGPPQADAGPPPTGELVVAVSRDGQPVVGAEVLFHDASGRILQRFSTGTDGRARTRDRAAVAASLLQQRASVANGDIPVTQHEITTWLDVPRDQDLVLIANSRFRPAAPPLLFRLTLPGPLAGAARYLVGACFSSMSTLTATVPAVIQTSRCPEGAPITLIASAVDAQGGRLAHSSTQLPALGPDVTELNVTLPAWRTERRTTRIQFAGFTTEAGGEAFLQAFWGMSSRQGVLGPSAAAQLALAPEVTLEVADLAVEVPLILAVGTARTIPGGYERLVYVGEFDPAMSSQRFERDAMIVPAPQGLALEQSNPRRPRVLVENAQSTVPAAGLTIMLRREPTNATRAGDQLYTWTAIARGGPTLSVQVPDLGTALGDLIASAPPNARGAIALESDALTEYADLLRQPADLADRDGPFLARAHCSKALTLLRTP